MVFVVDDYLMVLAGLWALRQFTKKPTTVVPPIDDDDEGYTLILSDDFNGSTLDSKWLTPSGTWNAVKKTDLDKSNVSVSDGSVWLKVSKSSTGKPYRGCIIENKEKTIQYGKCEVRVRVPQSNEGVVVYVLLWPVVPAGTQTWPPEIDFLEISGKDANKIIFTQHWGTHTGGTHPMKWESVTGIDVTQFHTYVVKVNSDSLKWYVDGVLKATQVNHSPNTVWRFSAGIWAGDCTNSWGGCPSGTFPKYMGIDYIKLYKKD